jgi:hypothetical protein
MNKYGIIVLLYLREHLNNPRKIAEFFFHLYNKMIKTQVIYFFMLVVFVLKAHTFQSRGIIPLQRLSKRDCQDEFKCDDPESVDNLCYRPENQVGELTFGVCHNGKKFCGYFAP